MKRVRAANHQSGNREKISDILAALSDQFTGAKVTVGELTRALSGRAFGMLLLVLALPNLIPIPAPGLSALLGVPLIFVTFQMMLGMKTPWLPGMLARRSVKTERLQALCRRVVPWMCKLERVNRPRLMMLTATPMERVVALICVVLALMIVMPIPFGNAFPALAICLFAIGLMQRDGVFVIAGLIVTCISATVIAAFLGGLLYSITALVGL
ncbi:MAG: exopolysaccharide biosynthesis protein [Rickettsiales bacterium]